MSGTNVALSWQKSSGATGYVLEAGTGPGLSNIASVPVTTNSLSTTAPPGIYFARVRATNKCGSSAPSNEVTVAVSATPAASGSIFGVVDPVVLGTCSAATHDRGWSTAATATATAPGIRRPIRPAASMRHEHGDDPAL